MSIEEQTRDHPDDQYDEEQLRMGVAIEMEHTNDSEIAKKIAKDHLDEMPDYYTRLKAMERSAGELSGQQLPIKDFTKIAEDFLDPLSKLFAGGMDEKAGKILLAIDESSGAVFRMIFEALAKVYGASRIEASIHAASPGLSGSGSSNSNDLFTAVLGQPGEAWTGGYWSVKFNPTGILMRRLSESEAKREASEKNALFSNERARTHKFAGSKIGNYHADGTLMELHKILSVAEDPPGYKAGTLMALLDDGTHSVGDEAALSRQIEVVKDAYHEGTVFGPDVSRGDWMRAVPVGETEAIEGTVVHGYTDDYGRQVYVVEYVKAGKTVTVEIPQDRVKAWKPKGEAPAEGKSIMGNPTWKIIDENGYLVEGGFKTREDAVTALDQIGEGATFTEDELDRMRIVEIPIDRVVAEKKWDFFDPLGNLVETHSMSEEQARARAKSMGWKYSVHDPDWFSPKLNGDISFTVFQNEKHPLTVSAKDWSIKDALQDMGYPMDISPEIIDHNLSEEAEHFLHKLEQHSGLDKIAVTALPDNPYVESNPEWWDIRNGQRALKESSYTEYLAKATLGKVVGLGEGLGASAQEITEHIPYEESQAIHDALRNVGWEADAISERPDESVSIPGKDLITISILAHKEFKEVFGKASGKTLTFTEAEFRTWVRAEGLTKDARPHTGIYKNGKRIGSYFERKGMIEVELYTGKEAGNTKARTEEEEVAEHLKHAMNHLDTASGMISPLLHKQQKESRMNVLLGLEHDLEMWVERLGDYVRELEE